ncbi:izumo sperm-egg fusion protein 3 [Cricetulus griseus]|nr:izumo sperm-egg fusion protein 3 [Cricetulus griseus]
MLLFLERNNCQFVCPFIVECIYAFRGVKGCLECDPRFIEDVRTLLAMLIPVEVPGRIQLLDRQHKEIIQLSSKVSHMDKTLRLLAVRNVIKMREWLKHEFYRLGNETWKGAFIMQGKLLQVRQNLGYQLKESLKSFSEVACSEDCNENPKKADNREIALYLILIAEAVILASAVLLFHFCISHRRKMKVIRRTLKTYLEKKLEELVGIVDKDDENKDSETQKSNLQPQTGDPSGVESELQTGT